MPPRFTPILLYPVSMETGGNVLIRIQQWALPDGSSRSGMARKTFDVIPVGQGPPIKAVLIGLHQGKGSTLLKGEFLLPTGRYRIARDEQHGPGRPFDVLPDPGTLLRNYCSHDTRTPSWMEILGAFSPNGRPMASVRRVFLRPCCHQTSFFTRPLRRHFGGGLGLELALKHPLHLTLGNATIRLAPGEALVVNRDDTTPLAGGTPFPKHFKHIVVEPPALSRFMNFAGLVSAEKKLVFDPIPRPLPATTAAAIVSLEDAMRDAHGIGGRIHLETCLAQYLFTLLRSFPNRIGSVHRKNRVAGSTDPRLMRAMEYLDRHLPDPYDRNRLSTHACVSHQRLRELFHKHLGISPRDYLIQARLKKAKRLLADGNHGFAEVGRAVGYVDPRNFRRLYRRFN